MKFIQNPETGEIQVQLLNEDHTLGTENPNLFLAKAFSALEEFVMYQAKKLWQLKITVTNLTNEIEGLKKEK